LASLFAIRHAAGHPIAQLGTSTKNAVAEVFLDEINGRR